MKNVILFDLDGTLTDPKVGITTAVAKALKEFKIGVDDLETLTPYIGPPLKDSFMLYHGLSEEDAIRGIGYYRDYYMTTGKFENIPYEGIVKTLHILKDKGYRLAVATGKPTSIAVEICQKFGLDVYFETIQGSNLDNTRTSKKEIIEAALLEMGIEDASGCMMVGDREHDIFGASALGIPTIGVLYGYGSELELLKAGAVCLVERSSDLPGVLETFEQKKTR
ncbi:MULTISPECIES: HAD hydrolase-like protein [unclassified Fusibacter]|uniref:HAD hydrolase-like protein n=1 Tax=unclassified Fusibacter TaxID=2624464 RepID=UPI0010139EEA|nr:MULTISPECIES: HAD hydrolase-like protein [unclassified Fusibacter]MCK8060536.1 HAD hydrolase-like protein [Fusibacter sp. A2]NPE23010.1 HAD hydrolase-like protein [Fusibacter sp. A1]RXV60075.1 HAD family hydrolase [Fusibacter sp. A1]